MKRLLSIQPHFDDWEFTTAAAWLEWRRRGVELTGMVLVVTDGGIGHHVRSHAETAAMRLAEGQRAAALAGFELLALKDSEGCPFREATLEDDARLRSALWNAVVSFRPDIIFCPPLPGNPLSGCHNDHYVVASAVWRTVYLFAVPRAFDNYPPNYDRVRPAIVCTDDSYIRPTFVNLAVELSEEVVNTVAELVHCHTSQVYEWLPWIGGGSPPGGIADIRAGLHRRYQSTAQRLGRGDQALLQCFIETSWGRALSADERELFIPLQSTDRSA